MDERRQLSHEVASVDGRELAAHAMARVAWAMIRSSVASAASSVGRDPALAHHEDPVAHADDLGQLGRDHHDPDATGREVPQERVDLALRPDVHAAGRLVDEQDPAPGVQPLGEDDLLLVAARQVAHERARARRPDGEPLDVLLDGPSLAPSIDDAAGRHVPDARDRHVRRHRLAEQQAVRLAVLGAAARCPARWPPAASRCGPGCRPTSISPASMGSAPWIARRTSVRPAPARPAIPTISPGRHGQVDVVEHALAGQAADDEEARRRPPRSARPSLGCDLGSSVRPGGRRRCRRSRARPSAAPVAPA